MARPCGPILPRIELFWTKVVKSDGCWLWTGGFDGVGYGSIWAHGHVMGAHRFAYETFVGPIPEGLFVCHHCDVRACVRPDHLFVGTCADNLADMWAKGRGYRGGPRNPVRGDTHPTTRLLAADGARAARLYAEGAIQSELAQAFGVTQATVWRALRRHEVATGERIDSRPGWQRHPERIPRGDSHPFLKADRKAIDQVISLRAAGVPQIAIARRLGLSTATISRVLNGQTSLALEARIGSRNGELDAALSAEQKAF